MDYIYKPVDFSVPVREPVTDRVRHSITQVYGALCLITLCALAGAYIHTAYTSCGLNSAMRVCLGISWLNVIHQRWIWARVFCMMNAAISFGATVGPLLSHFMDIDPQYITDFFMASLVLFLSHMLSIKWGQRDVIYELTTLTAPLVTTLWIPTSKYAQQIYMNVAYIASVPAMLYISAAAIDRRIVPVLGISIRIHLEFISIVSVCLDYPVVQLLMVYIVVLFFLVHLKMHTIHSMALAAQMGENDLIITASVTFFTEFVGRSVYLAIDLGTGIGVMVNRYLENVLAFE